MSNLEQHLETRIRQLGLPAPGREYRAIPGRRFRFDFAWPSQRVLVEVDGGTWMERSGHAGGKAAQRDREKDRLAQLHGWRVFRFTGDEVRDDTAVMFLGRVLKVAQDDPDVKECKC